MPWTNFSGFHLAMHSDISGAPVNIYPCIGISTEPDSLVVLSFPLGETLYKRLFSTVQPIIWEPDLRQTSISVIKSD